MSLSGFWRGGGWAALLVLVLAGAACFLGSGSGLSMPRPSFSSTVVQPVGDLPVMPEKPLPAGITFDGCPPEGNGGDPDLNVLKNRVDEGKYVPVSFDSLTALTWPKDVELHLRNDWPPDSLAFIAQYEGIPVSAEGYIESVKESPPEPANCNFEGSGNLDWRLQFIKSARDPRPQSMVIVTTPRVRYNHRWTLDMIRTVLLDNHLQVRVSGWLFFDPEHPEQLGVTRATLWEIHPVMQIEVNENGRWVPLDKFAR